jgi:hypothetical protein
MHIIHKQKRYEVTRTSEARSCGIAGMIVFQVFSLQIMKFQPPLLSYKKKHSFGLLYIQNSVNTMMHTIEFWIPSKLEEIILCIEKYN